MNAQVHEVGNVEKCNQVYHTTFLMAESGLPSEDK